MTALSPPTHLAGFAWLGTRRCSIVAQPSRYLGALAVLATGIVDVEQYSVDDYSTAPTIGIPFRLNFIAAIVIAIVAGVVATVFLLAFLLANGAGLRKIRASSR